ncbi:PREDICTED: sacsin-like isoform X1 [Calidris pugnax]|uniref:sacsin-like isoform X1 n=2 Tax=Calidris pugnax TaxID=198806 RepID=UPI00071C4D88|nr:PREDICTED: sacsin-like isoform X1 [Calidris pugnax]
MALEKPNVEAFCQRAPTFLDYLHNILQKYPDGGQILKELVQNADDAGANEVVFVSDEREFDVTGGGLEGTQGPALLAYNDAPMSPRDWTGLMSPGVSHKREDPSTVGRFGLGFTSVYHLTDLPGVLSPPSLGVLDPECQVLPNAGARWNISAAQDFPGLFEPFLAGLEAVGQHRGSAQGTLFRFPLRRQPSGVATGVSDPKRICSLLQTFLTEAPLALLFLRHVRRVALHRVTRDGVQTLMGTLVASPQPLPVPGPPGDEWLSLTWCLMALRGDGVGDGSEWLVATGRATEGPVVALGSGMGCCPELSLAHPLRGTCRGRLCCFLPLPATDEMATGLPVHASAPFALSDDRRHLRWPEEGEEGEKDARWNALLLLGLLPRVYSHMAAVATALPGADAYSIWPDPECTPSSGRIRSLVTNVCQELATACTLVPATQGATGRLRAPEAVLLPEAAGDTTTRRVIQALLVAAGEPVVEVPAHVRRALALGMAEGVREATAGHVREVLRRYGAAGLLAADRLSLLHFVAGDGCHAELQGLPLLPRADGTFVAFGTATDIVYVDTSDCPRELLPGLARSFLPSDLEPGLDSLLRGIAKAGLFPNLVLLDPAMTAQTLRLALPSTWTSLSSTPVTWCPAEGPPQPPASWLPALWQFLAHHVEDLSPLEGLPLIPLSPLDAPSIHLAPLIPQSGLIFQTWEDQCLPPAVASVLEVLGCPVVPPGTWHRCLSRYVLPPSPLNALRALGRQEAAAVASRLVTLPAADVDTLRLYLADIPSLTEQDRATLAALPLFSPLPCLAAPQPTELVPASDTPALEPQVELPGDVVLPKAMLQCRDEADRRLLERLQKSLISAAHVALEATRAVACGAYAGWPAETQALLLWVLQHGDVLFAQSPPLQQACSTLAFLETPKGPRCPKDLYDPCESTLQALLGPEHFPPAAFHSPPVLRALRALGLRHGEGCLLPSDILEAAASVSRGDSAALDRAQALIKICNCPKTLAGFSAAELRQLQALPWVPRAKCTGKPGQPFLPPTELRSTQYQPLVGLAMHLTDAFVPEAEKKLGLSQSPPPERVWEQLRQLAGCRDAGEVGPALRPVYGHMQENLKTFGAAPDDAVVWTGTGFVLPCDAVLGYPEELELGALVPRVPPDFLPYSCLFRAWGVEARVSEERAVAALRCLGQDIDARSSGAGTAAELQVALAILEWLKSRGHQGEGTVPVPVRVPEGSGFALRPAASTVYLDMELEAEEDVQEVVHEAVPSSTAIFLGTELLSTRVLGLEPFTACGPSEPITLRLRNILREYGEEGDIFTEMVQNAEDAGATVCRFLLDLRCHRKATSGLLDPGMAACHGPALWAYNNALFTEDDFRNITRVGAATKEGQAGRIGRFGLGFNSVYRVTDVPAVLSGETLLIFDPNGTHLSKHVARAGSPGIRLDFSSRPRILRAFAEQFWPYHGIFGCCLPEPGPFSGSLFRLPFRTEEEAVTSQVCSEAFGPERVKSLGTSFLGSNRLLLLFLRGVREMSLEMLPDTATSTEDTVPLATLRRKEIQDLGAPGDSSSWAVIERLTACEETSKTTWHYLVLVCQDDGELLELFHRNTKAGLHPLPPVAGVALPLARTAGGKWVPHLDAEEGQVFCHLPMPVASGLPIHVHGAFSILSNRKGLWDTAERGEWNRVLLRNAVPAAWLRALNHLRTMHEAGELESYEYHVFWPDTNTARYPFTEAVTGFYQAVAARDGPRLFSDGCSWCSLQDARFLHQAVIRHPTLGALAKHVFAATLPHPFLPVALPEQVRRGLGKAVDAGTYDWPRFYCELVLPNLKDLSVVDRDALLLHALDMSHDEVNKVLQTVPCIPATPHGHLQLISCLVHPRGRTASLYDPKDGRFPTGDAFLSAERLSQLERLGMVKDTVTLPELLERAKTVQLLWTEDRAQGCHRAACILELLRDAVEGRVNNTMQAAFQIIPFLPGTLPTGEHVLLPATQLYHHLNAPLVGLIHPILDPKVLGENFSLPKDVASFLGLDRQPPAATVLQQLQALSDSANALPLENLQASTHSCYAYLNTLLQRDHSIWDEVASAVCQGEPFILVGSHFVPVMAVAQKLLFEASPYLHQLPEQYLSYRKLWECVGLRHAFAWDDYAQVLCNLAKMHAGERLPAAELDLALRLVSCGLMADDKEPDAYQIQQLFLPDQEGILHPQDRLHFNDTPWLPLDKDVLLCHEKLSRATALRCGVRTTRHWAVERSRLLTADLSSQGQPFGAHEDLTTRLKNILAEYPACSRDMVTELLQNADDAGARLVHFVWDRRQHPARTTFSEKWNDLQGPALCIYSDSPFQQQDIEGIQCLGVGGKQGRQDVTGRYGLGFNTVFHFTDCPAFLTGDSALCIFDPHRWYVPIATTESPGGMFAVNPEFKKTFPDIYDTFLPSFFNLNQGVLFRLPLRTAAGAANSRVSFMVVRDEDIRDMETVLAEKGEELVLFLRHLRTVVFSEIPPDGKQLLEKLRVATELTDGDAELRQDFQARLSQTTDGNSPTSVSYIMRVKTSKNRVSTMWRVVSQIGVQEGAEESPVLERLPYGAVAGCLEPRGLVMGKAFCTLPLPLTTGLPVHINANFSVDAARRNLRQDKGSREAAWNSFLLRHLVAPLYCAFLTRQQKALEPQELQFKDLMDCQRSLASRYLRFFPAVGKGTVTPTFQDMVRDVYRHLSHTRLPLVPVYHVKPSDHMVTITWASPGGGDVQTEPYFLMEKPESCLQEVLQCLNMNLVPPFTKLKEIYEEFVAAQVEAVAFQPASLRRFLKALALPVPSVLAETPLRTPKSCSVLLKKCLEPANMAKEELEGLPLLATEDGYLNALSMQHPVFRNEFAHLFPCHRHRFAHKFISDLVLPDFVKKLSLLEAKPFIQEALGQMNSGEGKWLKELWVFFSTVVSRHVNTNDLEANMKLFMDHFQDMVVLPVQHSKTGLKPLLPLSFLPKVLHQCETDVAKVLHKLGIPVLQKSLLPSLFALNCLRTRTLQVTEPRAVLALLADTRDHLHWKDLEKQDVNCLLRFVQGRLDSVARDQLRLLPLFRKYGGDYVAVAPYCKVLVLSKQCPELPQGAETLYSLEKGILLLTADEIHQDMAKDLKWELTDGRKLFKTVVLPRLSQLTVREHMEALRLFFALQTMQDDKFTEDVVAAFKTVAFIPDADGVPHVASYFYNKTHSFCILRLQHRFVPESFFAELHCKERAATEFLHKVGVCTSLSEEDFVALAQQIEREATQARCHSADLLDRQKEMLHILLGGTLPLSKDFLWKIASIHFLPPLDIPQDLIKLHPPFAACTKPVALKGSVYHCQEDVAELLWTTATILPKPLKLQKNLLKAVGVLVEIPTTRVVANLEQVCRAACQNRQKVKTRTSVLQKVYDFLQTHLEEVDAGRLAKLPVVLAKSEKMTVPRQVVLSLQDEADFYPYLLKPHPCIIRYADLLQHLGVVPHPTLTHYSYVLAQIHQESRVSGALNTTQKKTALLATRYFFQLLRDAREPPDSSTVADLYLLSTADRLEPSHKLYFNDCVSSSIAKGLEKIFVFMAELPESRCNTWWLLQKLPEHLRPRALSKVTEQQLEEGSLRPCHYGSHCPGQRHLQTLLVSPWFRMGLEALLQWQSHRSMVRMEGDGGFTGEQLKVQCCEDIRTVLIYRGAKVEGSSQTRVVHVCQASGAQRLLYIRHMNAVLDRHQVRVLETLAQEINIILGGQLEASALSVLREMLVCQEPRDIVSVLEENDVPLVGAALETELEKKLQEEAVAKGKPRKDQHSLMPELSGNSLATLGQQCAVKGPKRDLCFRHNTASHGHGSWLCNKEAMTLTPSIPEAQRWLRQAESDLQAAHNDIRCCCPNWVLFKVHQALEKALVAAALCHAEAFEAPVELVGLAQQLEAVEPKLRGLVEEVKALHGCGVDGKATQYPSCHPFPVIPSEAFGSVDEEEVLKRVQGVLGRLQDHLGRM